MSFDGIYIGVYDITNDRERSKVDKILKGFGFRVQKSVFECRMRKGDCEILLAKLEKLNIKTGFVKLYRLDAVAKHRQVGAGQPEYFDGESAYVVG